MISEAMKQSAQSDQAARRERLSSPEVIQKSRAARHPSGSGIHRAFIKTTPDAVSTVTCYLDVPLTGQEITVNAAFYAARP